MKLVEVPSEAGFGLADAIQQIFADYVLDDGEFTISRDEASEIYSRIIRAAITL